MSYDSKCYELAEHFLPTEASDRLKGLMAQAIQDRVEDFCNHEVAELLSQLGKSAP